MPKHRRSALHYASRQAPRPILAPEHVRQFVDSRSTCLIACRRIGARAREPESAEVPGARPASSRGNWGLEWDSIGSTCPLDASGADGFHSIYRRDSFVQRVRELTDRQGVPVVYDSVGRSTFEEFLDCLEPRGLMVSFGNASGKPAPFDLATLTAKGSLFVTRSTLLHYAATHQALRTSASALFEAMTCSTSLATGRSQRGPPGPRVRATSVP